MRVSDLAICVDGLGENWLGGANYFRNLLEVFDAADVPDMRLHLLTDDASFLGGRRFSSRVCVHELPMLRRKSVPWVLRKALQVSCGRDVQMVAELRRLGVKAVVFSFVSGAVQAGIPCMPWIPDFQFRHHPELYPPSVVAAEQRRAEKWIGQGDALVVSSQSAGRDAQALFALAPDRLHVLQFAPRLDFAPIQSIAERDAVFARYRVDRPYVFLPHQYWLHKNHRLVIDALDVLRRKGRPAPLVISTGKTQDLRDPTAFASFETALAAYGLAEDYRVLGVIDREHMLVLMGHSMAVLNPSRFEGWSTTVEEAKALGKPLLVSDIAVHREQVQGLHDARLFGPDDALVLAEHLALLQEQQGHRGADAHPPHPDPTLHAAFSRRYVALLRSVVANPLPV